MRKKKKRINIKSVIIFLFIWLFTGFTLGTLTLMGPVRWAVNFARDAGWNPVYEDWLIRIIIVVFVLISFGISLWFIRLYVSSESRFFKLSLVGVPLAAAVVCVFLWMNPRIMQFSSEISTDKYKDKQFDFGPYPDKSKLETLKKENYTAVISLLHEAVVPFEPTLLAEEKSLTDEIKLEFIHIPMLPWISENESALQKLKEIASTGKGKYYVHCYLGKDRISVAKRIIQETIGIDKVTGDVNSRNIDTLKFFERGNIVKLEEGQYLTPYPTDEEYFGFIINGNFKSVVSLLTYNNPDDIPWIVKEENLLKQHLIDFENMPIDLLPYNPFIVKDYVDKIKEMSKPTLIHAFLIPSPQTDIFLKTYLTENPVLHNFHFERSMLNGRAELLDQNIVFGPRPEKEEFKDYLLYRGIRAIAYLGENPDVMRVDQKNAMEAALEFSNVSLTEIKNLNKNKTWFIYGSSIKEVRKQIQ